MLKIRLVRNKQELQSVMRMRIRVFVKEQKVPKNIEIDEFEGNSKHIIVLYDNKPIGCARIRFLGNKAKLERIALLKEYRGKGFGNELMRYMVNYSKRRGAKEAIMHAQHHMQDFYKKHGFRPTGKPFMEAGIKHIKMFLKLKKAPGGI